MKYANEFILLYTRVYLPIQVINLPSDWNNQNKPIICFNKWNAPSFIIYPPAPAPVTYWNKRHKKSEPRRNEHKTERQAESARAPPQMKRIRRRIGADNLHYVSEGFEVLRRIHAFQNGADKRRASRMRAAWEANDLSFKSRRQIPDILSLVHYLTQLSCVARYTARAATGFQLWKSITRESAEQVHSLTRSDDQTQVTSHNNH